MTNIANTDTQEWVAFREDFSLKGYAIKNNILTNTQTTELLQKIKLKIKELSDFWLIAQPAQTNEIESITQSLTKIRQASAAKFLQARCELSDTPEINEIVASKKILEFISNLTCTEQLHLVHFGLICALPGNWILNRWHQDAYSGPHIDVVVNIPLVDTNASNGGLRVIEGAKHLGFLPHTYQPTNSHDPNFRPYISDPQIKGLENKRQLDLNAGSLVLLDRLTPHAGNDNLSNNARLVITARYSFKKFAAI